MSGWIHALKKTVITVKQTVHGKGCVIEMLIPEALTYRSPWIQQCTRLARQHQGRRLSLKFRPLSATIEQILIVPDRHNRA